MKTYNVRVLLGALLLFCVIAAGFTLWYHHEMKKLAAEDNAFKQRQEERNQAPSSTPTVTNDAPEAERLVEEPMHPGDTNEMPQDTAAQPEPIQDAADLDAELSSAEPNEEIAEDVPVSPYGFGPYPPLPVGWPADIWPRSSPEHELMVRVEIKLISQGINVEGSIMENNLVFPTIDNTVYIRWDETNGERYIAELAGDPDACKRLRAIEEARGDDFAEADIPSDLILIPLSEGGIDPYEFLDVSRR